MHLMDEAIAAYNCALEVTRTRQDFPDDWASDREQSRQRFFGGGQVGARDGTPHASLGSGIAAYHHALEVWTRAHGPLHWAMAQGNLATSLQFKAERTTGAEASRLLEEAVMGFHAALEIFDPREQPNEWIRFQTSLGRALLTEIQRGRAAPDQALSDSIAALREVQAIRPQANAPKDGAAAQSILAHLLLARAKQTKGSQAAPLLDEAISGFKGAVEIYAREKTPRELARTQVNLAIALQARAVLGNKSEAGHFF